ncbi:Hypothetical predicted protein, partial [Xyrichtys novacula]
QSDSTHHHTDRDKNSLQPGQASAARSLSLLFSSFRGTVTPALASSSSIHPPPPLQLVHRAVEAGLFACVSAPPSDPAGGQKDSCDSILKVEMCLHADTKREKGGLREG